MTKITKEEIDSLKTGDISVKAYNEIKSRVDERFSEIIKLLKDDDEWFDYGNLGEHTEGYFDPKEYSECIEVGGKITLIEPFNSYLYCQPAFPTRFLYEDNVEEQIKSIVSDYEIQIVRDKENKKKKREDRKARLEILKTSITSKLTDEELKIINFKD